MIRRWLYLTPAEREEARLSFRRTALTLWPPIAVWLAITRDWPFL